MDQRVCKRCLLRDMSKEEYFDSIFDYIQSIKPEDRADEAEYEERLSRCRECDRLVNGMCAHCGCFVEIRAVKKRMYCPDPTRRW